MGKHTNSFITNSNCYGYVGAAGRFTNHTNRGNYVASNSQIPSGAELTLEWDRRNAKIAQVPKCEQGDVVGMQLDMNAWILSFSLNGKRFGDAFKVKESR